MISVLLTAFGPYDKWQSNSSWLALQELVADFPDQPRLTTRLLQVDLAALREKLPEELAQDHDVVLHLGQAPGTNRIQLEAIGLNIAPVLENSPGGSPPADLLSETGPVAYRSQLPLAYWARALRAAEIPVGVSYHAGTYLCNASLYLSHWIAERENLKSKIGFMHVPLAYSQVTGGNEDLPSLASDTVTRALRIVLELINRQEPLDTQSADT